MARTCRYPMDPRIGRLPTRHYRHHNLLALAEITGATAPAPRDPQLRRREQDALAPALDHALLIDDPWPRQLRANLRSAEVNEQEPGIERLLVIVIVAANSGDYERERGLR